MYTRESSKPLALSYRGWRAVQLSSPCFVTAYKRHSTVVPFQLGQALGHAHHLLFARWALDRRCR